MHKKFDSESIEKKWSQKWQEEGIYNTVERDQNKEKEYVLVEWPYPSGNLHIGHWYAFAVPDIYARYRRMNGKQVLFPMGFDAFGLPAENAAIKRNLDPKQWTNDNIAFMRQQLANMGNSFAWDKTTSSTDPEYYKWTQWMFTKFFETGLAYRGTGMVNWCPGCNTVIANEQVLADGTCERCGNIIEKKEMPQWMIGITKYADRLIDDLEDLDWAEHIKEAQRRWIGRSEGAEIDFKIKANTASDTFDAIESNGAYNLSDDLGTVTVFTTRPDTIFGTTYLVLAPENPFIDSIKDDVDNYEEIDDYIKLSAQKAEQDRLDATKEKTGVRLEGVTAINPANNEEIPVFIADYVLGGYGTGAIMAVPAHDERDNEFAKKNKLPITVVINEENQLINSNEFDGMSNEEAKRAIVKKVDGRLTNTYRLRDWSVGRQRYWGVPIPIVYDPSGKAHAIPKEHLPWLLPEDVDFRPTGEAPLAKSRELKDRTEKIFGAGWTPEVETMDTFVDSSWYFLRYLDAQNDKEVIGMEAESDWMQVDIYFGGAEHTTMHLLYSRFWQKALFDLGIVTDNEPYKRRINRGLILGPDGNKMSKSKGNVIDPDEQVRLVGADSVKMYLAFMGPYEGSNYPWDPGGIAGVRRFLERVYGLKDEVTEEALESTLKQLNKTVAKVKSDIEAFKFNTAISAMMIFINQAEKEGLSTESYQKFLTILAPFAPFLTEELWHDLGKTTSIHLETFPEVDENLLVDEEVEIGVQINGKMRGRITISREASEQEALETAQHQENLASHLVTGTISKVIYVPGRILNIIITNQ